MRFVHCFCHWAEIVSVSVYLQGTAAGTCWQHPVCSEGELPHKNFPALPHTFAMWNIHLTWEEDSGWTALVLGALHFWGGRALCSAGVCSSPVLSQVHVGIVLSPPAPLPAHFLTSHCTASRHVKAHKQMQFDNEVFKCSNTHDGAAVANRNVFHFYRGSFLGN